MDTGCIEDITEVSSTLPSHVEGAIACLAATMIAADDVVDADEITVAHEHGALMGVRPQVIDQALDDVRSAGRMDFRAVLDAVPPHARQAAAALLFEIANVDDRLDRREVELLEAVRDAWNVELSFLTRPLVWDERQQNVIEGLPDRQIIVSAGPGMGKTSVACARVAYLVETQNVSDGSVWLVSFTRAAVAELNGRIDDFADDPNTGFAVKISTLDSQAWKLRHGFEASQIDDLFGGHDTSIKKALELLDDRDEDIRDALADMEHILIDEAQDITGDRARFLMGLLDRLPDQCGVTVFHDDAQAIYDHAMKGDDYRFVEAVKEARAPNLEVTELRKVYRTEDPKLLALYENLRLDILDGIDDESGDFGRRADIVRQAAHSSSDEAFGTADVDDGPDPLVLYRQRVDVARASSYLSKDGISHRLRMSGLSKTFAPWLALTLGRAKGPRLDRSEFEHLHAGAAGGFRHLVGSEGSVDERWETLQRIAGGRRDQVDIDKLRAASRKRPDALMMKDYGNTGPILGTIHASKGREAERVVLQMNKGWGMGKDTDFAEESRVLFVGASRAKDTLSVRTTTNSPFFKKTKSERIYVPNHRWKNAYQVQIGTQADYDVLSALRRQGDIVRAAAGNDGPLSCSAHLVLGDWTYALGDANGRDFGLLTTALGRDCMEIGRLNNARDPMGRGKSPRKIDYVYIHGYGTAIAPPNETLPVATGGFGSQGVWLIPLISAFTLAFLS